MAPLKIGQKILKENQGDIYTNTHKIKPGEGDISQKTFFWATLIYALCEYQYKVMNYFYDDHWRYLQNTYLFHSVCQ